MGNIPYIDILILAMIAIFILNRLRNVLGKKTGNETSLSSNSSIRKKSFEDSVPDKVLKESPKNFGSVNYHDDVKINDPLNEIRKIENGFDLQDFLLKAKKAFEHILNAYSKSNLKVLEKLLDRKIFDIYKKDIEDRSKRKEYFEITIIGVKEPIIKAVSVLKKLTAEITLEYSSEQVHTTKNDKGEVVDGDVNQILQIKEKWTFKRDLKSKNPNWTLISISEGT